jgi:hypothetical protein
MGPTMAAIQPVDAGPDNVNGAASDDQVAPPRSLKLQCNSEQHSALTNFGQSDLPARMRYGFCCGARLFQAFSQDEDAMKPPR